MTDTTTDVALVDHETRFERTWGATIGEQAYQADVLVIPLANELPPEWMAFTLLPIPVAEITPEDWFMVGASPHVAQRACHLISVKLTPIDGPLEQRIYPVATQPNRATRRARR